MADDLFPGAKLIQLKEWGFPQGVLRPTPPASKAFSVVHITANLATAEGEAAWRKNDPANQNSATFFNNRDGSTVQCLGDPLHMDPWANGDVRSPDLTNPRIAAMVRDGVNANERTIVAIENVGNEGAWGTVPGGYPITEAQERKAASIIRHYHLKAGVPISRETIIGHYQLNSVARANCPSRDKSIMDRIVRYAQGGEQEEDDMLEWVNKIQVLSPPALVTLRPETSYRRIPDLSPESQPVQLGYADTRVVIGTVEGFDFGKGPLWLVMVSNNGGLIVAHSQDEVGRIAMSTSSVSSAQLEQAKKDAAKAAAADVEAGAVEGAAARAAKYGA